MEIFADTKGGWGPSARLWAMSSGLFSPHSAPRPCLPLTEGWQSPRPHAWRRSHSPLPARWHLRQHVATGNVSISGFLGTEGCSECRAAPGWEEADSGAMSRAQP